MKTLDIKNYAILVNKKINEYTEKLGAKISENNPQLLSKTEEALKKMQEGELSDDEKNTLFDSLKQYHINPVTLSEEETFEILSITQQDIESCFV